MQIINQDERSVIVAKREGVEAYFADFYINDLRYTVISKDNVLTITEPQELTSMEDVLAYIKNADFTFVSTGKPHWNGVVEAGFIVRSKIDNSIRWLRSWI